MLVEVVDVAILRRTVSARRVRGETIDDTARSSRRPRATRGTRPKAGFAPDKRPKPHAAKRGSQPTKKDRKSAKVGRPQRKGKKRR
jgi:hypothetical protein